MSFSGVTNPFFSKALQHWPNVIIVGEPTKTLKVSPFLCSNSNLISFLKDTLKVRPFNSNFTSFLKDTKGETFLPPYLPLAIPWKKLFNQVASS